MTFTHAEMSPSTNWLDDLPLEYVQESRNVTAMLDRDLDAAGVHCYAIARAATEIGTVPAAIPVFVEWLTHLEEKVPGPETAQRASLRSDLITKLDDPAARGNRAAIDAVFAQFHTTFPLREHALLCAGDTLTTIAQRCDYPRIVALLRQLTVDAPKGPLIDYLGQFTTAEAITIVATYLNDPVHRSAAVRSLTRMMAHGACA